MEIAFDCVQRFCAHTVHTREMSNISEEKYKYAVDGWWKAHYDVQNLTAKLNAARAELAATKAELDATKAELGNANHRIAQLTIPAVFLASR